MCLGIPGRILAVTDPVAGLATVDVGGVHRTISVRLLAPDPPGTDDWVLVHVGFALARIDEEEAHLTLQAMRRLGDAYTDEIATIAESVGPTGPGRP